MERVEERLSVMIDLSMPFGEVMRGQHREGVCFWNGGPRITTRIQSWSQDSFPVV